MVQPLADLSKPIMKFSTAEGRERGVIWDAGEIALGAGVRNAPLAGFLADDQRPLHLCSGIVKMV
jgi:hypothetical protein